jgi:hypothetical protein
MNVFRMIVPAVLAAILSGCPTAPTTETNKPNTNTGTGSTGSTTHELTVTKSGDGSVQGSGIDCGSTCSMDIAKDDYVLLTAISGTGSSFVGWSGACGGTATCTVTMDTDKTVSANFTTNNGGGVVVDATKPTVTVSSPATAQTVSNPSLIVTGTASDNKAVINLEYSLNNAPRVALSVGTNFSFPVMLSAGSNSITVYAKDAAGNEGASSITVTYSQPSFTITPEAIFFVGQNSVTFWKVKITGRQNFATSGAAFDSVTLENNAILGTGAGKIQFSYRKADSSQDEIVLEIGAGSSVPVGDYAMTVRATAGSIVKETAVTMRVAPCSLGCP